MNRLEKRGLKRHCQNEQCGLPFYDLNRAAFACPNCGTAFIIEARPPVAAKTNWRTNGRSTHARRTEEPLEQTADALEDIATENTDELETTDEAEVLLETDDDEGEVAIDPAPGKTIDE